MDTICTWKTEGDEFENVFYTTMCNKKFYFINGTIEDNMFNFCPYCGNRIIQIFSNATDDNNNLHINNHNVDDVFWEGK